MWRFGSPAKELTQPSSHLVWSPGPARSTLPKPLVHKAPTWRTDFSYKTRRQHQSASVTTNDRPTDATMPPFLCLSDSFFTFEPLRNFSSRAHGCLWKENSHRDFLPRGLETVLLGRAKYLTRLCVCVSDARLLGFKSCMGMCVFCVRKANGIKFREQKFNDGNFSRFDF